MRLKLTVNYKNGNSIEQVVNYLHFENGTIFYTCDKQDHAVVQTVVKIPVENIASYDLEKIEEA